MVDLGESEKVTAVLKLDCNFISMGRSNLDFLVNIFEKRSFWCFQWYAHFFSYSPEHIKRIQGSCVIEHKQLKSQFLIFFSMGRSNLDFLVNIFEKRSFWCLQWYAYFFSYSPEHKKLVQGSCEMYFIKMLCDTKVTKCRRSPK